MEISGKKSAKQAVNGPIWLPQGKKPQFLIHFWVIPFPPFSAPAASSLPPSGVIRNGSPQYKGQEGKTFLEQNQLNELQMVQFECPSTETPEFYSL